MPRQEVIPSLHFNNSLSHILQELARVDYLLQEKLKKLSELSKTPDAFRGLYITDREVDSLMSRPIGFPEWAMPSSDSSEKNSSFNSFSASSSIEKQENSFPDKLLRLSEIVRIYELAQIEIDVLLIALAPELDLRYERVFAFLQDDVTKKRPTVDLVLNLFCRSLEEKVLARKCFYDTNPLINFQLINLFTDSSQQAPPLLGKYIKVDDRIVEFLLGSDNIDARLRPFVCHMSPKVKLEDLFLQSDTKRYLSKILDNLRQNNTGIALYLKGRPGIGKQTIAEALARELNRGLLVFDGRQFAAVSDLEFNKIITTVIREASLVHAVLYWKYFDGLSSDTLNSLHAIVVERLQEFDGLVILSGENDINMEKTFDNKIFLPIDIPELDYAGRRLAWSKALNDFAGSNEEDINDLAKHFRMTPGQIYNSARTALNLSYWKDPEERRITSKELNQASRQCSTKSLSSLGHKVASTYSWNDIVLPDEPMQQLKDIFSHLKYRAQVYDTWGFGEKLSLGTGLPVLFTGPSGTGKTMAAEIMANELNLDLYKIDLSSVVSKYVGETEKQLAIVFDEARIANVILFLDEADALLGKRTEVKDAHDRYANIEVSYLLQKLEEYDGLVIMATNLARNIDAAFSRRIAFTVNFPIPDQAERFRIWQTIWPKKVPMADDVDLLYLARQFILSGGNIKNIALAAAFQAAEYNSEVTMQHILRSTKRELKKMGIAAVDSDFGEYAHVLHQTQR